MNNVQQLANWKRIVCIVVLAACVCAHVTPTSFAKGNKRNPVDFSTVTKFVTNHPIIRNLPNIIPVKLISTLLNPNLEKTLAVTAVGVVVALVLYQQCMNNKELCEKTFKNIDTLKKYILSNEFSTTVRSTLPGLGLLSISHTVIVAAARNDKFISEIFHSIKKQKDIPGALKEFILRKARSFSTDAQKKLDSLKRRTK